MFTQEMQVMCIIDHQIMNLVLTLNAANVLTFRGLAGNSLITAFTAQMENPKLSDVPVSYFNGTITGNQLIVNWWDPSNIFPLFAPSTVTLANGSALSGTGTGVVTGGSGNTYTLGPTDKFNYPTTTAFRVIGDAPVPGNQGPRASFSDIGLTQLYSGKTVMSNGYMWNSYPHGQPAYTTNSEAITTQPPSITVANNTLFQLANSTFAGLCFAQGDPELGPAGLELMDNAAWAAMSFAEVLAKYVAVLSPKVGGPLTNGTLKTTINK